MDTCRICLRKSSSLKPLFDERNNLANRINDIFNTHFQVVEDDCHPKNICYDCLTDLHHTFKFFENARFAEHQLFLQVQQESIEIECVDIIKGEEINEVEDESTNYLETEIENNNEDDENEEEEEENMEIIQVIPNENESEDEIEYQEIFENALKDPVYYVNTEDDEENVVYPVEEIPKEDNLELFSTKNTSFDMVNTFTCNICFKIYEKKGSYQYHMKTKHVEDKKFRCSVCDKAFAMKGDYTRHSRIHTNEKRFSCGECGKKFTDRSTHLKHEKVHTGVKPYQCEICPKSFTHKFVLFNHHLTHTGEKKFICPECSKKFARKSKMKDHFTRIHKRKFTEEDEKRSLQMMETEVCAEDVEALKKIVETKTLTDQ